MIELILRNKLMRIFEVKNNLVKIFYETSDTIFLSSFVMIKDSRETYIAQIMHLESSKHGNVAIAKIIFNVTEDGVITTYSGTIPAINSAISNINSIDFLKLIQGQNPILIGEFIEKDLLVSLDKSLLENKLVICSENQENSDLMIKTLNRQIKNYGKKTVIIDTEGQSIFDKNSLSMSEDFRLPINNQIINYIYENGLEYKSARSKAIMQETFLEINYYLSSLEEPYIPVNKFIDILEKQYNKSKLPELVLLKNALVKFNDAGIFARNIMEYKNLFDSLLNNQTTVLDVSLVDETIQREVISYVYNLVNEISDDYYVFIKLNNGNSDKKLLKQIFSTKNIYTIITCSYTYKYLTELKKIAKDLILFTPLMQQQDFASYNTFLTTLGRTEFVVYGQATQFMPLIVSCSSNNTYSRRCSKIGSKAIARTTTKISGRKNATRSISTAAANIATNASTTDVANGISSNDANADTTAIFLSATASCVSYTSSVCTKSVYEYATSIYASTIYATNTAVLYAATVCYSAYTASNSKCYATTCTKRYATGKPSSTKRSCTSNI